MFVPNPMKRNGFTFMYKNSKCACRSAVVVTQSLNLHLCCLLVYRDLSLNLRYAIFKWKTNLLTKCIYILNVQTLTVLSSIHVPLMLCFASDGTSILQAEIPLSPINIYSARWSRPQLCLKAFCLSTRCTTHEFVWRLIFQWCVKMSCETSVLTFLLWVGKRKEL